MDDRVQVEPPTAESPWAERLVQLSGDLLCVADHRGRFTFVNPAFATALGRSADELTSVPYMTFVHPDDRAATAGEADRLEHGEHVQRFRNRYQHRDGSWRAIEWVAITDVERALAYCAGRDVTGEAPGDAAAQGPPIRQDELDAVLRERAEHRRMATEALSMYRALFDNLPVAIFRATPEGEPLEVNRALLDLFGYADFETFRDADNLFRWPGNLVERHEAWKSAAEGTPLEIEALHADGHALTLRVEIIVDTHREDQPVIEGVVQDVTQEKVLERAVEFRSRMQTVLLEVAQELLLGTDIDDLARRTLRTAAHVFDAHWAVMCDVRDGQVYTRATHNFERGDALLPLPEDAFSSVVAGQVEPLIVSDWNRPGAPPASEVIGRLGVRSSLGTSIRSRDTVLGTLTFHSDEPDHWTEQHAAFIAFLSSMLGLCLEQARVRADLLRTNDERKRLLGGLVAAQEAERRRIAADIHDDAVQVMSAVTLRLHGLRRRLTDPADLVMAEELESTVRLSISRLRNLLFELSPPALERYGLPTALRMHLREYEADGVFAASVSGDLAEDALADEIRTVIYRIVQEALVNIRKHAGAKQVTVELRADHDGCRVRVIDDGVGYVARSASEAPSGARGHMGLTSMRERAELAGGWWMIKNSPLGGTVVEFWVPDQVVVE